MYVYILFHTHEMNPGEEDEKLVGVYSTRQQAEEARKRAVAWPGLRDAPDGFGIDRYQLDEDQWTDGYVTIQPGEE